MDLGMALASKLAKEPDLLWAVLAIGAPISATVMRERERVSLAAFLPSDATAWIRFAKACEPADAREEGADLARDALRAKFWEMPGVLQALAEKQGAPFLSHIGLSWAKQWMEGEQDNLTERFNALTAFERRALSAGVADELVSIASGLLSGVGRPERLALEWLEISGDLGERLKTKYPSDSAQESWGMLIAAATEAHIDYGKTPHWLADGICACLMGPGFGSDQRAREQAVSGFDKGMVSCRFKAGVERLLEASHSKLEPLRISAALSSRVDLKPSRGALKA